MIAPSKRIAVVMGGPSSEHDVSRQSGAEVIEATRDDPRDWVPVIWRTDGRWEFPQDDVPIPLEGAIHRLRRFDAAFLALHGPGGEDGHLQAVLQLAGIPFTGSGMSASAIAMDKVLAKRVARDVGLVTAREAVVVRGQPAAYGRIAKSIGVPCAVKPVNFGSSDDVYLADDVELLQHRADDVAGRHGRALVEEWVSGTEVTVAVVENPETGAPSALPLIEIRPADGRPFFDRRAKYDPGEAEEICPARLRPRVADRISDGGLRMHVALGCRGFSRSDFIVRDGIPVYLETNTIPGLTRGSLLPKAAAAAGLPLGDLFAGLVNAAMRGTG